MNYKKRNLSCSLIISIFVASCIILPFSVPVVSNVIVRMNDDNATNQAIATLVDNAPNSIVVDYRSPMYSILISRVIRAAIWVSHGSEQGILADNALMLWGEFAKDIAITPSKDIVLACNSKQLESYVSPQEALLFDGSVESNLGALLVSLILGGVHSLNAIASKLISLATGQTPLMFLELTTLEFAWDTINFMIGLMLAGAGLYITQGVVNAIYGMGTLLFIDTALLARAVMGGY
ncbi:MAG: hypothetical protein GF309_16005 [Candidatus Lokiarchaeota archaeon]|nr:hypothetical protein [Candidatus Lokiarchaeota archaeon]